MSKIVLNDVTNLNALSVINDNFDKLEQELQNKVLYRDNPAGEPNTLENDVDANGNSLYNIQNLIIDGAFTVQGEDVGAFIGQAADAAADAALSATAAANSATAANASAIAADASADSADASEAVATTKASEASTSATNAASSAASAAGSATTATTQAGIATAQAVIATTKASEAASSASNAATSETNAATSATNAATSATSSASSASSAAASAAAAALALDNFDDRYLGSKSVAPILDNDGNALIAGELYFNDGTIVSDDKGMWVYDGGTWIAASAASQAILVEYKYVATAGQTVFTGADANALVLSYTVGSIIVTLNGSKLLPEDYTASTGSSITLAVAAALNDELSIVAFSTFDIANTYTQAQADVLLAGKLSTSPSAVGTTNLAANAVSLDKLARVGTAGQVLMSGGPSADPAYGTMTNSYVGGRGQVFTSNGTFTIPTGVTAVKVTVVGGGGGAGGTNNCSGAFGAGGGGGGSAVKYLTSLTPGNTLAVTVGGGGSGGSGAPTVGGTGGTSSVASGTQTISTISATGGGGGGTGNGGTLTQPDGGLGSGGDLNIKGGVSGGSVYSQNGTGTGGPSFISGRTASTSSIAGVLGSGGSCVYSTSAVAGGAGGAGVVMFEW